MRRLFFVLASVAMLVPAALKAQGKYGADSANCVHGLSFYTESYKNKDYANAVVSWRKAYKSCPPQASQNMFIHGTTLLKMLADKATGEQKAAIVDTILTLQDQRALYYPKYQATALNNKGQYVANYLQDDPARAFGLYSEIVALLGTQVKGSVLENQFRSAIDLYNSGNMPAEAVMNLYTDNISLIDTLEEKDEKEAQANDQAKHNIESLLVSSKIANCDDLVSLFTPRLEADPDNIKLIKTIVSMLNYAEDCSGNDLYLKAVTSMDRLEPSAASAYALYRMNAARGNMEEAFDYLEKAANDAQTTADKKSSYLLELARVALGSGSKVRAFEAARKVVALGAGNEGAAYMIMGKVWGATHCGGDEINSRKNYWVACDYLQQAKAADASLTADANKLIGQFSAYFPTTGDAFMYGLAPGDRVSVSCGGLNATTTVRTNK